MKLGMLRAAVPAVMVASAPPPTRPGGDILTEEDEAALLAQSTFPIKPDDLIRKCKDVIIAQYGIQDGSIDESIYADDFRFCAPFVGGPTPAAPEDAMPGLDKAAYLSALAASASALARHGVVNWYLQTERGLRWASARWRCRIRTTRTATLPRALTTRSARHLSRA